MTKNKSALIALLLTFILAGCQSMQGTLKGDYYYSPAAAYSLDLSVNTFRGKVVLDERCDKTGGSTTIWDSHGRMFRIDYLDVKDNSLVNAPRFASDMTLLNLVINNYLRDRMVKSPIITSVEAAHREFLDSTSPKSLFAIVKLTINNKKAPPNIHVQNGTYYYGFLLFKKNDVIYVLQHREPVMAPDNMKATLLKIANAMNIPGKKLDPTEYDKMRHMLSKLAPGDSVSPIRMCAFNQS